MELTPPRDTAYDNLTYTLNNGVTMPLLGFGITIKGQTPEVCYTSVLEALDAGYRHLDCAWFYRNEDEIGRALSEWLERNPGAKRCDVFVTTKVWPHLCGSAEDVRWSLEESLRKLQLEYVDCFLMHWPVVVERTDDYEPKLCPEGRYIVKPELTKAPELIWPWFEILQRENKTRSIGVSNMGPAQLDRLLAVAHVKPVANQIEIHPFLHNSEAVQHCLTNDILPVAFSPLGYQTLLGTSVECLVNDPELTAIADEVGGTAAQVCIAWGLQRGYGLVPQSATPARIWENKHLVRLGKDQHARVSALCKGRTHRFCDLKDLFGYDVWEQTNS